MFLESEFSAYHEALGHGKTTCERRVRDELENVGRYNERLNAFITVLGGEKGIALSRARELDAGLKAGRRKRPSGIFGVPLAVKDNIFFGGFPTTAATYYFKDFVPSLNADIVDDALGLGCIPLGKTNLHELALGGTSAASFFGPVRNPHDVERVAGGSSGGSAVSVALSRGPVLGLGTDTGGSIRVPAALCGIMGFKPTLGTLSLAGVFPLSATLDHAGLLTKTMPDMVKAFEHLAGTRRPRPQAGRRGGRIKVGVLTGHFQEETEGKVSKNFWKAVDRMEASGNFQAVEVPTDSSYETFTMARAAIQLKEAAWFYEDLVNSEKVAAKMNQDVLTLLGRGMRVGQVRYLGANLVRLESVRAFGRLLKGLDVLAVPTTRVVAPRLDDVVGKEAGRLRRLLLQNTEMFNLCGFPALSIPSNPGSAELPTAMQLACGLGEDELTLRAGDLAMQAIVHQS
ncbi:MAG TPA: amidase [Nitrososphaerales archaeon]|nr:amidase [Nitrososphaerales archaeon]